MKIFDETMAALDCCIMSDPDDKHDCQHCPMCNYGVFMTNSCVNGLLSSARQLLKTFADMKEGQI